MSQEKQTFKELSVLKRSSLIHNMSKIFTAFLLTFIVFSFSGCSDTTGNQQNSNGQAEAPQQEYKVGDQFKTGYFNYYLQKVEQKSSVGNQFLKYQAGGVYEICYMAAINGDKEPRYVDRSMFKLVDDQNRSYSISSEATTAYVMEYNSQYDFFLKQANPGVQVNGLLVFDIPKDAKGLKLEVSGGFFSSEKAYVKLD